MKSRKPDISNMLRLAKPHLVCCVESEPVEHGEKFDLEREISAPKWCVPHINSEGASYWGQLIEDGFDASGNVGLGPVYYRHVVRAGEMVSLSTFMASRDQVLKLWGPSGLDYCDPITGKAPARIEMKILKGANMQNGDYNTVLAAAETVFVKTYEE